MTTAVDESAPEAEPVDIATMLEGLAQMARESGQPTAIAAGTFAIYPMEDGAMMLVMHVQEGPMAAEEPQRARIPSNMIRAVAALAGGSKAGAVKALLGRRG